MSHHFHCILVAHYYARSTFYSSDMNPGGKHLRAWHLGFRTDYGLAGMSDPFDMAALVELVLTQGFPGIRMLSFQVSFLRISHYYLQCSSLKPGSEPTPMILALRN